MRRPDETRAPDPTGIRRAVLLFIDGLGTGADHPDTNPMSVARGPLLSNFLGNPTCKPLPFGGAFVPVDAALGVEGLPQSATGQTSLFTGRNAQADIGRHLFGFPNARLREILFESSLLKRVAQSGKPARFANAFRPLFFELPKEKMMKRLSASTVATLAAGVPFFGLDDLRAARALYQDFTNGFLIAKGFDVPARRPEEAGRILATMSREHDFLLYEYFITDRMGHSGDMKAAIECVEGLECFIGSFLDALDLDSTLVVVASDHGNIEDLSFRGHTNNPAQCLVFGPSAPQRAAMMRSILDVAPEIMGWLGPVERG